MNRTSLLSQIFMVIIAIIVGVMYISPAIAKIKTTQDSTDLYIQELAKVSAVNTELASRVAKVDSVPLEAKQALLRYVPDTIDEIVVMKDIQAILAASNIVASGLAYNNVAEASPNGDEMAIELPYTPYAFTVAFDTTYEQLKEFFSLIETNDYLFEISSLDLSPSDSGLLSVQMTLKVFSRKLEVVPSDSTDGLDFISEDIAE